MDSRLHTRNEPVVPSVSLARRIRAVTEAAEEPVYRHAASALIADETRHMQREATQLCRQWGLEADQHQAEIFSALGRARRTILDEVRAGELPAYDHGLWRAMATLRAREAIFFPACGGAAPTAVAHRARLAEQRAQLRAVRAAAAPTAEPASPAALAPNAPAWRYARQYARARRRARVASLIGSLVIVGLMGMMVLSAAVRPGLGSGPADSVAELVKVTDVLDPMPTGGLTDLIDKRFGHHLEDAGVPAGTEPAGEADV